MYVHITASIHRATLRLCLIVLCDCTKMYTIFNYVLEEIWHSLFVTYSDASFRSFNSFYFLFVCCSFSSQHSLFSSQQREVSCMQMCHRHTHTHAGPGDKRPLAYVSNLRVVVG